jgi:hypothetical protein
MILFADNLRRGGNIKIYSLEGRKQIAEETKGPTDISSLRRRTYLLKIPDCKTLKFTK